MIDTSRLRSFVRDAAPWAIGALALEVCLHLVWPAQIASAIADRTRTEQLRGVVPDVRALREKVDSLGGDSAQLSDRVLLAKSRQIAGSDPAALLAAKIVPLLGENGWKLDRVKAEASNGFATLDVGASTGFAQALQGLRQIRRLPLSIKIRKLAMRPGPSGRLSVDIQLAVPTREAP